MSRELNSTFRRSLDRIKADVGTASALPNASYVDPDVYEAEKQVLFFQSWAAVDFASEVPEAGDAKPVEFLGTPMLLVRDRSGRLRVFENVCRHRGTVLVEERKNIPGVIRCPYHSWCYGLDGRLVSTPHVGGPGHNIHEAVRREELGLLEVRSHVWLDVVFINVSGDAPSFEEHAATLLARWKEFDLPIFRPQGDSAFKLDAACNWKLAVENYCESYHLPWVHPGLNAYSRLEDHYHILDIGGFSGQGTTVYRPSLGDGSRSFGDFHGLSEKWLTAAEYIALYPNVLYGVHRDHVFAILLIPQGPERTQEHVVISYADRDSASDEFRTLRKLNEAQWKVIF